jgi:hypothetical protein
MSHVRRALLVTAGLLLLGSAACAQDQGREFHWKGTLPADKMLAIQNVNGNIDASASEDNEIEVTAEKSGPGANQVRIDVNPSSEGVMLCAIYPGSSGPCGKNHHYSHNGEGDQAKVHFTVRVPKNLRFSADNVNGSVNAVNMGRFVHANSVNGNVNVSTSTWTEAETVNGSIKASMGDTRWNGTLKIESVNGSIELDLPDDFSADVKFSSLNGRIESDFPLTMWDHWPVGHSASAQVGKGGRELAIKTVNGSVELKKRAAGI